MSRRATIAACLLVLAACGGATSTDRTTPEGGGPQTVAVADLPTGSSISEAYRFAVRPQPGWQILSESDLSRFGPAAAAGAMRTDGPGFAVVVVEAMPGISLERAADLTRAVFPQDEQELVAQDATFFLGYPAIRQVVVANADGVRIRWVNLMFLHQEHFYRLTVWGDGLGDSTDIERFFQSFSLLEGDVVRPPRDRGVAETEGVDWRVTDGRFESLAANITVEPTGGWGLSVGSRLRSMNRDAVVGLRFDEPDIYAVVISEHVPESAYGQMSSFITRRLTENLGGTSHGVRTLRFLGREVELGTYHAGGFEYLFGVVCDEGRCRQLLVWYVEQAAAQAAERLASFPEIRDMTRAEQVACSRALSASQRERRTLGPTFAYRGSSYVDFARGLTITVPDGDHWMLHGGAEARQLTANAELQIKNAILGVHGLFMSETLDAPTTPDAYHALVRDAVGLGAGRASAMQLGNLAARVSEGDVATEPTTFRFVVVTAVWGTQAYRLSFWGWPEHIAAARGAIDALLAGTTLHGGPMRPFELSAGRFVENRFGYSITLPGPEWAHDDETQADSEGATSAHGFVHPDGRRLEVAVVHASGDDPGATQLVVDAMRAAMRRQMQQLGAPTEGQATLAGRPALVDRWGDAVQMRTIVVDRVVYSLIVHGMNADEAATWFTLTP